MTQPQLSADRSLQALRHPGGDGAPVPAVVLRTRSTRRRTQLGVLRRGQELAVRPRQTPLVFDAVRSTRIVAARDLADPVRRVAAHAGNGFGGEATQKPEEVPATRSSMRVLHEQPDLLCSGGRSRWMDRDMPRFVQRYGTTAYNPLRRLGMGRKGGACSSSTSLTTRCNHAAQCFAGGGAPLWHLCESHDAEGDCAMRGSEAMRALRRKAIVDWGGPPGRSCSARHAADESTPPRRSSLRCRCSKPRGRSVMPCAPRSVVSRSRSARFAATPPASNTSRTARSSAARTVLVASASTTGNVERRRPRRRWRSLRRSRAPSPQIARRGSLQPAEAKVPRAGQPRAWQYGFGREISRRSRRSLLDRRATGLAKAEQARHLVERLARRVVLVWPISS